MKYKVTYIRTLTLENEMEADSLEQAAIRAEEIQMGDILIRAPAQPIK